MTGSPLRVAVYHDLPSGGAKRSLQEQVRRLTARGHRVDVFAPATAEASIFPLGPAASSVSTYPLSTPPTREELLGGYLTPSNLAAWAAHAVRLWRVERQIAADIDAANYDVVLAHPSQFTHGPLLLNHLDTPSLLYCHEPMRAVFEEGVAPGWLQALLRPTLGRLDTHNLHQATRVVVNSRFIAEQMREVYGLVTPVCYHGVDASRFRPLDLKEQDYVLSVGGLDPLKGFDFLVDALGHVPDDERPPLRLVSDRGQPGEQERLRRRAREAGVELAFYHRVSDDDLVRLYSQAKLALYAPVREPFGFVPLEAMACRTAVLAVPEGGVRETVEEGRTGFTAPRDPRRFGQRVSELLRRPSLRQRVAQRARRIVTGRWSWARAIDELEGHLRDVARTRMPAVSAA